MLGAFFVVGGWAVVFFTVVSLVGGIMADIPGARDEPAGNFLLQAATTIVRGILHYAWHYPFGTLLGYVTISCFYWFFMKPRDNRLKSEYDHARQEVRSQQQRRSGRAKPARKKRGRRR